MTLLKCPVETGWMLRQSKMEQDGGGFKPLGAYCINTNAAWNRAYNNNSSYYIHSKKIRIIWVYTLEKLVDLVALRRAHDAAPVQVVADVRVLVVPPHRHVAHCVAPLFLVWRVAWLVLIWKRRNRIRNLTLVVDKKILTSMKHIYQKVQKKTIQIEGSKNSISIGTTLNYTIALIY